MNEKSTADMRPAPATEQASADEMEYPQGYSPSIMDADAGRCRMNSEHIEDAAIYDALLAFNRCIGEGESHFEAIRAALVSARRATHGEAEAAPGLTGTQAQELIDIGAAWMTESGRDAIYQWIEANIKRGGTP